MLAYIQEQPRTGVEMRARMEAFSPGMGKPQIADAVRIYLALIQPFPAGTWGFTGRPTQTQASSWLGRSLDNSEGGLRHLILRYLAAFGPASAQDIQEWSGLTSLQGALEALRAELRVFRDEQGGELFDLPDAPRPPAETPAPVRFLPDFDNLLFAYANRRRVVADEERAAMYINSRTCTTFLVDGFVRGIWKIERRPASIALVIEPLFEPLLLPVQDALSEEGERLMRWMLDGAETFEIEFRPSS